MKTNRTAREMKNYDKDPVFGAVVSKMTEKGKGFFIISCGSWSHPLNTVPNCYAIMFDGFCEYKFELTDKGFKVAQILNTHWLTLKFAVGSILTQDELIQKIKDSE